MNEKLTRVSPLIVRYRGIKAKIVELDGQRNELRDVIAGVVNEDGAYRDDEGYAEFRDKGASVSFDSKTVNDLAEVWAESDDPVLASCGKSLIKARRERPPSRSIYIK